MLLDKIEELLKEVSTLTAQNAGDVEQLRLKYLSKKGEISALMGEFRNVAADQKKAVGMKINELNQSGYTASADTCQERNHRHLRTDGLHALSGSGD